MIGRLDVKSIAMLVKITFYFKVTAVPKKIAGHCPIFPSCCLAVPAEVLQKVHLEFPNY